MQKKIVIIGGGFSGVQTALRLSTIARSQNAEIVLISDREHFEYYPALHGFLSVQGPAPYHKIPLQDIFGKKPVTVIIEKVTACNVEQKTITLASGATLSADYIVLAVGAESAFFGIQGLPDMSFPFQNVHHAQKLRTHIETVFAKHCDNGDVADCVVGLHFVVVGAGPNGVDLAGELAGFAKHLCKEHNLEESLVTVDLIEGASNVLPMMPKKVQEIATKRLRKLGVNVLCNRQLLKQGSWTIALADMTLGAKTLIWTAGTTSNELVTHIPNMMLQKKNRIKVNEYLQIDEHKQCFVIGDIADTQYSGLAQTAIHDGNYVGNAIIADIRGRTVKKYSPQPVAYNIGVGHGWSITSVGGIVIAGKLSSWLRKIIDLKYFISILPLSKVIRLNPFK
jgi:NADH:ubiquinone reductase (H+-translocating)